MSLVKRCDWCSGNGWEPAESGVSVACGICEGAGYSPVCGTLSPTKSFPQGRPFRFYPGDNRLFLTRKKKTDEYRLIEFAPDFPGARAFACIKVTGEGEHHLLVHGRSVSCDCGAATWGASARCNRLAVENGEQTFATLGCAHADFVELALREGLMDLPAEEPAESPPARAAIEAEFA